MPVIRYAPQRDVSLGLPAALLLHAIALALLFLAPRPAPLKQPPENSIEVEFVEDIPKPVRPAPQPQPSLPPQAPARPADGIPPGEASATMPRPGAIPPPAPAMIQARKILSDLALADPRSRQARKMLPLLDRSERMEQLCNIEAMAQLRAWNRALEPDLVIAYALAQTRIDQAGVTADGAAFHSRRQWFTLQYRCRLSADISSVSSFEFLAGAAIPRNEWARHDLPAGAEPQD